MTASGKYRLTRAQRTLALGAAATIVATIVGVGLATSSAAIAATPPPTTLFVVDTSGSMAGAPLEQAKAALSTAVDALKPGQVAGLRRFDGACGDGGALETPLSADNRVALHEGIDRLAPGGGTPSPDALRAAAGDLAGVSGPRQIVFISDGQSSCGDPCPVAAEIAKQQGVDFKVHTVGFNAPDSADSELACIARETGGTYVSASDQKGLEDAIGRIVGSTPTKKKTWVALGDSYSSGEGNPPFDLNAACHRSSKAWPSILAADSPNTVTLSDNLACSGATGSDLTRRYRGQASQQSEMEKKKPDLVTVTIGGNDVGFRPVITFCYYVGLIRQHSQCVKALKDEQKYIEARSFSWSGFYNQLKAPNPEDRQVAVIGYPRLFPTDQSKTTNCGWLSDESRKELIKTGDALNQSLRAAANGVGVKFVDTTDALAGHELCTADSWVQPVRPYPNKEYSAHPSERGQKAIAQIVKKNLGL